MHNEMINLSNIIFHNGDDLTLRLLEKAKVEIDDNTFFDKDDFIKHHYKLLEHLIKKIKFELIKSTGKSSELNLDYDPKNQIADMDVPLSFMVELLISYRSELLHYIQEKSYGNNVSTKTCQILMHKTIQIFDQAVIDSIDNYDSKNQGALATMKKEIVKVSTPLVPVGENVSVLPLIGEITEDHTVNIYDHVIPAIKEQSIPIVILDFSGVYRLNNEVIKRCFDIAKLLELLGIEPIITGIRPDLSQMAVQAGFSIKSYQIYRNVNEALKVIA
ncbi:STAS domain-containing protein [Geomicrobium sp. JCM 19055]|uniref:STAS domain-containing protein n=1 Tax=Geomicrobium sp. JCM 19055 TaxID=1460649 RepID=UPI00045ED5DD|nr:STAS domain-containing protein [Geomicrobium sp. JCM 19055]GAJ99841.1 blue-light photoreceptor [Geomicrobium sp. JCM 19055]